MKNETLLDLPKIVRNINFYHSNNPSGTSLLSITATTANFNIEKKVYLGQSDTEKKRLSWPKCH